MIPQQFPRGLTLRQAFAIATSKEGCKRDSHAYPPKKCGGKILAER
jgi:hypothetical protein